jgi:membrane protein DedA with SNARE-associated domain
MAAIGQIFYDALSPLGTIGLLLCVFLLFYIDSIVFPTLPELFTIIIFSVDPTLDFACEILVTIAIAEVLGLTTLYLIVKRLRIPKKIQNAVSRYSKMLLVKDEKIILLNRIAPVLPFMGAFVALCKWSYKKSVGYTVLGGVIKYGIILTLGSLAYEYLSSDTATVVTIILVLVIIVVSLVLSYLKKEKMSGEKGPDGA